MATLANAGALASLLGVDLRDKPKTKPDLRPSTAPCRCAAPAGGWDPRVWATEPGRCEKCGRWVAAAIGTPYEHSDLDGLANLAQAVENIRDGLLAEACDDGVLEEDDYISWLETRLAACERDLARITAGAR